MNLFLWAVVLVTQVAMVASQIMMKRAMVARDQGRRGWALELALSIAVMTVWFLLWVGLMSRMELSKLVPLEGISPLLIVLGAAAFLGERLSLRAWAGLALTCVGIVLVAGS